MNRKFYTLIVIFLSLPAILRAQSNIPFSFDGTTRYYNLHIPDELPPNAPLIFVLHGYTNSSSWSQGLGFDAIADTAGFAVCYPQGSPDIFSLAHWDAGLDLSETDDVGFLSSLAQYLQSTYNLDPEATYSCGFSNGGFMSYSLACEAPDVFRAIASVSGTMSGFTWNNCNSDTPIPVLQIHGTNDGTVPIDGSMTTFFGWGGAPEIASIVDYWVGENNCTTEETVPFNSSTTAYYYRDGIDENEVWYYRIQNLGHTWPKTSNIAGFNAHEVIWQFFRQHKEQNVAEAVCATPANLQSTILSPSQVQLQWDSVPGATAYQIKGRIAGASGFASTVTINNTKNIGGLNAGASYEWKLRARCDADVISDFSPLSPFMMPVFKSTEKESMISLGPNPADQFLRVEYFSDIEDEVNLAVIDLMGRELVSRSTIAQSGLNMLEIELQDLVSGLYFLAIRGADSENVSPFLIQH